MTQVYLTTLSKKYKSKIKFYGRLKHLLHFTNVTWCSHFNSPSRWLTSCISLTNDGSRASWPTTCVSLTNYTLSITVKMYFTNVNHPLKVVSHKPKRAQKSVCPRAISLPSNIIMAYDLYLTNQLWSRNQLCLVYISQRSLSWFIMNCISLT